MSTVQYDFNQPEGFQLEYQAADWLTAAPGDDPLGQVRLDRAVHGRPRGALCRGVPGVALTGSGHWDPGREEFAPYLRDVLNRLRDKGVRVELDESDDRFPKKIRNASKSKVPYVLIAGEDDRAAGAVSFRYRDGSQRNGVPLDDAIAEITAAVAAREQVVTAPSS
jgi:threonyl-tRNA synthetase